MKDSCQVLSSWAQGWRPEATYEPFAPSSFYQLAELKIPAPESGTYHIAVFEPFHGGHYSLAIGQRETFAIIEWTGIIAGFLFIGTGFLFIFQMALAVFRTSMVQEAAVTILFAIIPIILGIFALFVWAGFLVGPVLAVLASFIPVVKKNRTKII